MDESIIGELSSVENTYIFVLESIFFYVNYIKKFGPISPQELSRCLKFQRPQVQHLVNTSCGSNVEERFVRFLALFPGIFRVEDTCSLAENSGELSSIIFRDIVLNRAAALIKNGVSSIVDIKRDFKRVVWPVEDYEISNYLIASNAFYITENYTVDLFDESFVNNLRFLDYDFLVDDFLKYFKDRDICLTYEDIVLNTHKFSVHVEDGLFVLCALYSNRHLFSCQGGLVSLRINTDGEILSSMSKICLVGAGRKKKSVGTIVKELYGDELLCWTGTTCHLSSKSGYIKVLVDLHDGSSSRFYVYFYKDTVDVLFYFEDLREVISCDDVVTFDAVFDNDPRHKRVRKSCWTAVSVRFKQENTLVEDKLFSSQITSGVGNTGAHSKEYGISKSDESACICDTDMCRKVYVNMKSENSSICDTCSLRKQYGHSKSGSSSICSTGPYCKEYGNSKCRSTKRRERRRLHLNFRKQLHEMMGSYLLDPTVQLGDVKMSPADHNASSNPYRNGILRCDMCVGSMTSVCEMFESDSETCDEIESDSETCDEILEGIALLFSGYKLTVDDVDPSGSLFACKTSECGISVVPDKSSCQSHYMATVSFNDSNGIQTSGHAYNIPLGEKLEHFEDEDRMFNHSEKDTEFIIQDETGISIGNECINDTGLSSDFTCSIRYLFGCDEVNENDSETKEQASVDICSVGTQDISAKVRLLYEKCFVEGMNTRTVTSLNLSPQFDTICCNKLELDDAKLPCICYQAIEHSRPSASSLSWCHVDNLQSSKGTTLWINQHSHKNSLFLFAEVGDVYEDFAHLFGHYKGKMVLLYCAREVLMPSSSLTVTFEKLCTGTIVLAFVPYINEDSRTFLPTLVIPVDVAAPRGLEYYESLCPEKYFKKNVYSTLRIEPNLEFHDDFNLSVNRFSLPVPKPLFSALKTLLNRKNAKRQSRSRRDWKQTYIAHHEFSQVAPADFSSDLLKCSNGKKDILLNDNPARNGFVVEGSIELSTSELDTLSESSVSPDSYVTCPTSDSDVEDESFSFTDDVNHSSSKVVDDTLLPSHGVNDVTEHYNSSKDLTFVSRSSESPNTEKTTSLPDNEGASLKATGMSDFTFTKMDCGDCGSSVVDQAVLVKASASTYGSKGELHNGSRGRLMFRNQLLKSKTCFKFKASHYGNNPFKAKHRKLPRRDVTTYKDIKLQNSCPMFTVSDVSSHVLKARVLAVTAAGMLVRSECETFPVTCSFPLTSKDFSVKGIFERQVKMHLAVSRMSGIFPHVLCLEMP